jgi:pimeloyl-ACP methyl ester carboxylesterase
MEPRTLRYKKADLHYGVKGEGPAIVLLHGFGEDGSIWKEQFHAFPGYRLIVPHLPGSGLSEMQADMSIEGLADAVNAILLEEKVHQCILLGHSMGGYIVLAIAERYRNKILGFGLVHSTAYADSEEKIATRRKGIAFIKEHGASAFLRTSIPNLYSTASKVSHPELIESHLLTSHRFSDAALITYYESMIARPDRTAVLRDTIVPVLFVLGREDSAIPLIDGLQQCHLPLQSHVHLLEESGHMGMVEEAAKTNACLNSFVTCLIKPLKTA